MSGGSYEYFYTRAPEELNRIVSDLQGMAARCTDPKAWGRDEVDVDELAAVGSYLGALALKLDGIARAVSRLEQVTHDIESALRARSSSAHEKEEDRSVPASR